MTTIDGLLELPDVRRLRAALATRPGIAIDSSDGLRRLAAIALVLRPGTGEPADPELLMIKRAEAEGDPWSGHVACPGGRMEPGDHDLEQTAIRETWEETGVDLARDGRVLGALDDISPRTPTLPPIIVRPYVAVVKPELEIVQSSEVAEAFWVPLAALRERAAWGTAMVPIRGAGERQVSAFRHGAYTVWGLTERVLRQFLLYLDGEPNEP
ncbi:MAG TPA: CoA pyrophosphatase [Casimicrobiaceae bacterium]|jgi:8-oxo-dGTP pyrophosphatase MutT (NUDIX family)|nr:CoA pyrophosphatase [Casimicrobiaceae bacterium]